MLNFKGKIVIITGAAGGIGSATAKLFIEHGATVALADIRHEDVKKVAAGLGPNAVPYHLDLAEDSSIKALISGVHSKFGRIDVLHNNAALLTPEISMADGDVETMDVAVWDQVFRVNLRGMMLMCKYALPIMVKQGGGVIINTSSNLSLQGNVVQAAYSCSKAAINQLTRAIATSHARYGVRCNAVLPGLTLTKAAREHIPAPHREAVENETLVPFLAAPEDIAPAVLFLASDEARNITGHLLVDDGGTAIHVPGFDTLRKLHPRTVS